MVTIPVQHLGEQWNLSFSCDHRVVDGAIARDVINSGGNSGSGAGLAARTPLTGPAGVVR